MSVLSFPLVAIHFHENIKFSTQHASKKANIQGKELYKQLLWNIKKQSGLTSPICHLKEMEECVWQLLVFLANWPSKSHQMTPASIRYNQLKHIFQIVKEKYTINLHADNQNLSSLHMNPSWKLTDGTYTSKGHYNSIKPLMEGLTANSKLC